MGIFLLDLAAEIYVEHKYGVRRDEEAMSAFVQHEHHLDVEPAPDAEKTVQAIGNEKRNEISGETDSIIAERSKNQVCDSYILFGAFLIHTSLHHQQPNPLLKISTIDQKSCQNDKPDMKRSIPNYPRCI